MFIILGNRPLSLHLNPLAGTGLKGFFGAAQHWRENIVIVECLGRRKECHFTMEQRPAGIPICRMCISYGQLRTGVTKEQAFAFCLF